MVFISHFVQGGQIDARRISTLTRGRTKSHHVGPRRAASTSRRDVQFVARELALICYLALLLIHVDHAADDGESVRPACAFFVAGDVAAILFEIEVGAAFSAVVLVLTIEASGRLSYRMPKL
jgi:hypothetical protein